MAYYDAIAGAWHAVTGFHGGPFKREVLNDLLIGKMGSLQDLAVLELGAGNGYFMPLALRRCPCTMERLVITDASTQLLDLAQQHFRVEGADYQRLDVRGAFPFQAGSFDLVLATMVFNEVSTGALRNALRESHRILRNGRLIVTVTHPAFVGDLARRGELRRDGRGFACMPGPKDLRLPIHKRSVEVYESLVREAGFECDREDVFASERVLSEKRGLRHSKHLPIALVLSCAKRVVTG